MKAALISLAIAALAGAAHAQVLNPEASVLAQAVVTVAARGDTAPGLNLSRPHAQSRYASSLPAGIARTSVDHRFDEDAVGSFGYLCGLNPGQKMTGAAGAAGYDPMGKFLGAKLSLAFH